ncbi:SpaH/EbpB family LPXTG-anchored major pilin [Leucobacter luti]|uniref:LPXTG-motif cell wall-anchored protein/fimbrial isopeptide formation D2 family protein n=1 Tax=Leucobacter luti TaxID=340320 RepID=A0A4Q7U466_9MICO|nr:SpaH/EbpB family LPXTG-anchored major pilin [Leucobacter luti]MBL3700649.1 isopeptide-forming domain-containing fimbrial protein [Leucobacter luti]RZT68511.1 LPXTG-motif cell wall-anchored protein/fimbrial isopeptide formation D2 family protein [Leucobacter luti]
MNTSLSRRTSAISILGVAALALGSVLLLAGPAAAVPGDGGTGTLTVHKLEQPESGDLGPNDGSEIETTGATPLVAGFTACTIEEIDLTNPADWERLANITVTLDSGGDPVAEEGGTPLTLTCLPEQTTAAGDGATEFTLPADKAYVVYESTPAENAIPAATPTVITIPYPGTGAAGDPVWNYDPHIYPKNTLVGGGATKDGQVIGDQVKFDIAVPIPPLADEGTYDEVRINDQLAAFLTYTAGSVVLEDSDGADVPLVEGVDYTLTAPSGSGGDMVVLEMLPAGLAKLDANTGGKLILTIEATATGSGSTANEAQITINGTSTGPGTGPSVVDPEEFFGGAHILKEAQNKGAATNVPLAGAKFDVYTAAAGATSCPAEPDPDATKVVDGDVSAADGMTPNEVLAEGKYCVYEVEVPAGYKGLVGGQLFEVTGEDAELVVVNTQIGADPGDLPSLPITGAAGSVLLGIGGAALLAVAGVLLNARRKRNQLQD